MISSQIQLEVPETIIASWQAIANILAEVIGVPAALIMRLSDTDIEVLVSSESEGNPYHAGAKERFVGSGLYCETVIKTRGMLLVPNALADEKWRNNPDIKLNMISYLGFPIHMPDKKPFGTICVLDKKENPYSKTIEELISRFRNLIEANIEIIYMNQMLGDKNKQLADYLTELQALRGLVPICTHCKSIRDDKGKWNPVEHYLIKHPEADFSHGICPSCSKKLYPDVSKDS
jgi:transcriptional regulator with GAF, ATPase, and Fis domain